MTSFNDQIRAASGRSVPGATAVRPVGDIGVGRGGGACLPMRPAEPSMSSLIRAQRRERRERIRELAVYFDGERPWVG